MDEKDLFKLVTGQNRCPQCRGDVRQVEKDTSSGREIREFQCNACGWSHIFDVGPALWKILSDAGSHEPEPPTGSPR